MKINNIETFEVKGLKVRTTNAQEMDAGSAKIAPLWAEVYQNVLPLVTEHSKVYGVYSNYESDATGAFDVLAGASLLPENTNLDLTKQTVQAGKYLTFYAKGEMPQAVIQLWNEVWQYFNDVTCPHTRCYTTDFEYYKSTDEVEICIAIQ